MKKGKYVSTHFHFDVSYLLEDDSLTSILREDENYGVKWFSFDEVDDKIICAF